MPPLARVLKPRLKQLDPVSPAAPDVVTERNAIHVPVLAAPNDMVAVVSTPLLAKTATFDDELPVSVSAPVMV